MPRSDAFRRSDLTWTVALLALVAPRAAQATLSVLAVDESNGDVGAVVVSCIGDDFELGRVVAIDPSVGGVVAQSHFFEEGRDEILRLLGSGRSPEEALNEVLDPAFDPPSTADGPSYRQYGAVLLSGASATFTGVDANRSALSRAGSHSTFHYTVQGNFMVSASLLDVLETGFVESDGSLAVRLTGAIEALGRMGAGDRRCPLRTADSGYFELHSTRLEEPLRIEVFSADEDPALLLADRITAALPPTSVEDDQSSNPASTSNRGCSMVEQPLSKKFEGKAPLWPVALLLVVANAWRRRRRHLPSNDSM